MHKLQWMIATATAGGLATVAGAQVSIGTVSRSVHAHSWVHAPPDNPNFGGEYNGSNTSAGSWIDYQTYGNSASGAVGYGIASSQTSQMSLLQSNFFEVSTRAYAEVEATGICSANGGADSVCEVHFSVAARVRASITADFTTNGGHSGMLIGPVGSPLFVTSTDCDVFVVLAPGEHVFRTDAHSSGACNPGCSHLEDASFIVRVFFEYEGCAADFDGDGTVDFFDYDSFVVCFEGGACPPGTTADFDGDGTVDFFDYDAFVMAFEAPC
ncbi:MAG: hypothetical protein AABZ53_07065 [Planctomycetota bacterium]